jgi:hypothetical protein
MNYALLCIITDIQQRKNLYELSFEFHSWKTSKNGREGVFSLVLGLYYNSYNKLL